MEISSTKANRLLSTSAIIWFLSAVLGQLVFVAYIVMLYGVSGLKGDMEIWASMSIKGHVAGDTMGNLMFGAHMLMAVILTVGGILQLIPQIRAKALNFHRFNGRLFIFTAFAISLGGLYLVWIRGAILSTNGAIAISLNAILIFICCYMAIMKARQKKIVEHSRWALRAFIVVNGVWFFRVGFMAWILIHQEAKWSTENLDGPFDLVWSYANYLLPLAILELYLRAKHGTKKNLKLIAASVLLMCTLLTLVGTLGAYMMMWGPNM